VNEEEARFIADKESPREQHALLKDHGAGVVGIRISAASLHQGDRIAFQLPVDYIEQEVTSIEVERQPVTEAPPER
jgi:hypothetical protein